MGGFDSVRSLVLADEAGQTTRFSWRKSPSQGTVAGVWQDLSMVPGNPAANYYANTPLLATVLNGADGLFHGAAVAPATKHLKSMMILSNGAGGLPSPFILCDYLLYYPFIDQGTTDPQVFTNTATLPRYTDGIGVQAMAVLVGAQVGGQTFQISYTNQAGVAGRTSKTVTCNSSTNTGAIATTNQITSGQAGPFIPLQSGDTGIRSIQSLTMNGADVGLLTLVLVKPLASFHLRGIDAPVEVDFLKDRPSLPRIVDGAFLNLLIYPASSIAGVGYYGMLDTIWN